MPTKLDKDGSPPSSPSSFCMLANCMSALAVSSHDIEEHRRHNVLPVPVGDSNIAFFFYFIN